MTCNPLRMLGLQSCIQLGSLRSNLRVKFCAHSRKMSLDILYPAILCNLCLCDPAFKSRTLVIEVLADVARSPALLIHTL